MFKRLLLFAFLGICGSLGGALAVWCLPRLELRAGAQTPAADSAPAPVSDVLRLSDRFEVVARRAAPAVAYVEATKPAKPAASKSNPLEESGSGVLVRFP